MTPPTSARSASPRATAPQQRRVFSTCRCTATSGCSRLKRSAHTRAVASDPDVHSERRISAGICACGHAACHHLCPTSRSNSHCCYSMRQVLLSLLGPGSIYIAGQCCAQKEGRVTAAPDRKPTLLSCTHRQLGVTSLARIKSQGACAHLDYSKQCRGTPTRRGISYTPTV